MIVNFAYGDYHTESPNVFNYLFTPIRHLFAKFDAQRIYLRIELDNLLLSNAQAAEYFVIGSRARSSSSAETMGLAPVVAHQIITAAGGELQLVKVTSSTGYLEASFPKHTQPDLSASANT